MIIRGKENGRKLSKHRNKVVWQLKKYCNDNHISISSYYKQKALILEEENTFLPVIIDKSMMLLILILTIIIFPVPNKISRFYWRTCYDYQYRWNQKIFIVSKQFCDMRKQIDGLALIVTSQFAWMSWIIACFIFYLIFHQVTFGFVGL